MAGRKKKKRNKAIRLLQIQLFLMCIVFGGIVYYYFGGYAKQVTDLKTHADEDVFNSTEKTFKSVQTSVVYDANGTQISVLKGEKDVYYLNINQIPTNVTAAIISIEDKKFYSHHGVDYKAIMRAVFAMIRNGEVTQGASTITQQLARNIFLSQEKTWQRKMEEIFIAQDLENMYSKNQILEFYLNNIYFGNGYYGIQAASKGYFNTTVDKLDLSQIAFLCAIPNSPSYYNPVSHMDHTITRRNLILKNMLGDDKITKSAYDIAAAEQITLNRSQSAKNDYVETFSYYCATRALMEMKGFVFKNSFQTQSEEDNYNKAYKDMYETCQKTLYTAGYRIYTSIDLNMQSELQTTIDDNLKKYTEVDSSGIYALQGSGACLDNQTGYVKAIVGGRSQNLSGYTLNRAYQSFRQPGSSIKPLIVYTPSLERGYTPDSIVKDEPIPNGPKNADKSYAGKISFRTAVAISKNTIAWKLFDELTPQVGLSYIKNMNFSKIESADNQLAAGLGGLTKGVSTLEMASGYATLENDGNFRTPTCIVKITDSAGNPVYTSTQAETPIYKQNATRMMTDMLTTVLQSGTGKGLAISEMPSAGKTGTTNDNKDGWFVGYTRYYTTSVWVGYDMPRKLTNLMGSSYPGSIWHDYMEQIHQGLTPLDFLPALTTTKSDTATNSDAQTTDNASDKPADGNADTKKTGDGAQNNNTPVNNGNVPDNNAQNSAGNDSNANNVTGNANADNANQQQPENGQGN